MNKQRVTLSSIAHQDNEQHQDVNSLLLLDRVDMTKNIQIIISGRQAINFLNTTL